MKIIKSKQSVIFTALLGTSLLGGCGGGNPDPISVSSDTSSSAFLSSSSAASNQVESSQGESSSSVVPIPSESNLVYAVNAGGPEVLFEGVNYQADRFYRGGTPNETASDILQTNEDALYQTERYGATTYQIPVTNANYSVRLHFVEMFQNAGNARSFSVLVEGEPVIESVDLFERVGANTPYEVNVPLVMVADENLTIELITEIDNATISGFAIYSSDGGQFVEPPQPEPGEAIRSAGCGTNKTIQNGRININVDGTNRSYILRVPDNYDNQNPYRLIMAYHWLNGNANQVAQGGMGGSTEDPFYGLWDLADNTTIFVAPEGIDAGWANSGGRDIRLTDEILSDLTDDLCIDEARIFATGFSYGAGMSNALACARGDVFRAVALYAGAQLSGCEGGTTPIAYFGAHGRSDSVLNISQGRSLRDRYARNNGCTAMDPPEPSVGSGTHICTSFQGCDEGYPVRWCAFDGDHNPTQKDRGQSKSWVPGEAWEFISQF